MFRVLSKGKFVIASIVLLFGVSVYAMNGGHPFSDFKSWGRTWGQSGSKEDDKNNKDDKKKDKIDLEIDSQCHYYQLDPQKTNSIKTGELTGYVDVGCFFNGKSFGSWAATDLGKQKFFQFADVKPGDRGEDTVSLHVAGGDACGRILIDKTEESGNTCTEPETQTQDRDCKGKKPGTKEKDGELWKNMDYRVWIDQGRTPGFQGKTDPGEGDNIFNEKDELIFDWTSFASCPKSLVINRSFKNIRNKYKSECNRNNPKGDGKNNGYCHGITLDGFLTEGVTYYYGFAWRLPESVGNDVQTDSAKFNLSFTAVPKEVCGLCDQADERDHKNGDKPSHDGDGC